MCGRYYIPPEDDDAGFQVILDQLRAGYRESPLLPSMKRGEIFPSDIVPAVTPRSSRAHEVGLCAV